MNRMNFKGILLAQSLDSQKMIYSEVDKNSPILCGMSTTDQIIAAYLLGLKVARSAARILISA